MTEAKRRLGLVPGLTAEVTLLRSLHVGNTPCPDQTTGKLDLTDDMVVWNGSVNMQEI